MMKTALCHWQNTRTKSMLHKTNYSSKSLALIRFKKPFASAIKEKAKYML